MAFNRKAYNQEYARTQYDRVPVMLRRDDHPTADEIRAHAAARGESMNRFFIRAAREQMERDAEADAMAALIESGTVMPDALKGLTEDQIKEQGFSRLRFGTDD